MTVVYEIVSVDEKSAYYSLAGELIGLKGCMKGKRDSGVYSSGIFYFCDGSPFGEPLAVFDSVEVRAVGENDACLTK
jgi:hypothetical protein